MSIIQGSAKQASVRGFYPKVINGSLRFNDDDSARLQWTPSGTATDRKKATLSVWVKLGNILNTGTIINARSSAPWCVLAFSTGDGVGPNYSLQFAVTAGSAPGVYTSRVFRDPSAWYHVVCSVDTTQATASNRVKIWINGEQETLISGNYPSLNQEIQLNSNILHEIGNPSAYSNASDFYLADFYNIDGQALTADDFGETKNGVWVAKDYAGTYGTNGFYLTFEDDTEVEAFNAVLWNGTGVAQQSVTGVGFSPDLVWAKSRGTGNNHFLFDTVRGAGRMLHTNTTSNEIDSYIYGQLESFDTDGMSFRTGTSDGTYGTYSGHNYVAWCWDAGANNAVTGHSSVTYTGNGATQKISGLPFQPDLVWIKERNNAGLYHQIFDSIRGGDKQLESNTTDAEGTNANLIQSFTPNGFVLGTDANNYGVNRSVGTYVAWCWDAGDSDPVSNTDGSITSTVKSSGDFSIVTYTGVGPGSAANEITVGHGLTSKPDFFIIKRRDSTGDWFVFTDVIDGSNDYLYLNLRNTAADSGNPVATDTVITLGGVLNTSGGTYVVYAWRNVTGKQKIGTYTGTAASGNTVTTGFRPGFLMIKNVNNSDISTGFWSIVDASRSPINPAHDWLFADGDYAENTTESNRSVTFTDTGFVVNSTTSYINNSGDTFIYAAFAGSYSDYITNYNTDGDIDSRVKANDTTGFSIVSYTGNGIADQTVGHGLTTAPSFGIIKDRDTNTNNNQWQIFHTGAGDDYGYFTTDTFAGTAGAYPTVGDNTTITIGRTGNNVLNTNESGDRFIAYLWAEKTGYSKFGSYEGNGSTDGPEIDCGFVPAFVLIKDIGRAEHWTVFDGTRETQNDRNLRLFPSSSSAESPIPTGDGVRFLSTANGDSINGFKITTNSYGINDNVDADVTKIYAAFADTREAAFWLDQSGNDNDWQPVNLDHNDTLLDSPTDNYCTWNPLSDVSSIVLSDGNLTLTSSVDDWPTVYGTMGLSSGQFYCEVSTSDASRWGFGFSPKSFESSNSSTTTFADGYFVYSTNPLVKYDTGTSSNFTETAGFAEGDILQVAIDIDAGKLWYGINGNWLDNGNPSTGANPSSTFTAGTTMFPKAVLNRANLTANFGQQPFKYDPPA